MNNLEYMNNVFFDKKDVFTQLTFSNKFVMIGTDNY